MKKPLHTLTLLALLSALFVGCGKSTPPPADPTEAEPQAANWEPESVDNDALPEGHTADDGHDHSADAHANCDHSAEEHKETDKDAHEGHDHDEPAHSTEEHKDTDKDVAAHEGHDD